MPEYISLLRGVNVSGKTIKMAELKSLYESLGLLDVKTYIQSGNVLFNTNNKDIPEIIPDIQEMIRTKFGFQVIVIIRDQLELKGIIDRNPFVKSGKKEFEQMYVTLMVEKPKEALLKSLRLDIKDTNDEFTIIDREIYLLCPEGYGRTVFSNGFFEKKLKVPATTRNWKTINKLYEISLMNH